MANELREKIKVSMRISSDAFDEEIDDLIASAKLDLGIANVQNLNETDALIIRAITTYCRLNWGSPDDYDRLKASYDEQKAQLGMCSAYNTEESNGEG